MTKKNSYILPVILVFVILNAFFIAGKNMLQRWNADQTVMIVGNVLLFVITLVSFALAKRGLKNPNPHGFTRSVYSSIMVKLFACIFAAFIYIALDPNHVNKPALFTCMGLYFVYTFIEVSTLLKMLRQKGNG